MTTEIKSHITTLDVLTIAMALTSEEAMAEFIASMPEPEVATWLAAILDSKIQMSALEKGMTQRMVLDGQAGQKWTIGGRDYGLYGSQQKGFREIPTMFANLHDFGVSLADLAASVSDCRVTNLRESASMISDKEKREAALECIESNRYEKGERGAPRFQPLDHVIGAKNWP